MFRLEPNGVKYVLDHIDGAYSYCINTFTDEVYHFGASTEVIKCT